MPRKRSPGRPAPPAARTPRRVHVIRVDLAWIHEVLNLRDRRSSTDRFQRIEVARRLALDEVPCRSPFHARTNPKSAKIPFLAHELVIPPAGLAAPLGHH